MLLRTFPYSAVMVQVISLAPDEVYGFDAKQSRDCVGTLYVNGVIAPEDGRAWAKIEKHRGYRPRAEWGGWTNAAAAATKGTTRFRAGPEGALWVCLSRANEVRAELLETSLVIPAGWGFVVGSGDVVLGDPSGKAGMAPAPAQAITLDASRDDDNGHLQLQLCAKPIELGWIEGGAQAGEIANYFRPDTVDREVTGSGDLLLVR